MNSISRVINSNRQCYFRSKLMLFSTRQIPRPLLRLKKQDPTTTPAKIDPYGWFLLIFPAASFGLGVWQIQRKTWKENLIQQLNEHTGSSPVELPRSPNDINQLEFNPVCVKGTFLHDKEIYMGPRTMIGKEDSSFPGFFSDNQGYLVITPFKLADRDETILVNRGWVSTKHLKPKTRTQGQVEGVVNVIGILRLNEDRPNFAMKNQEGSNLFFYRDLESMCAATGASPIFLDQTVDYNASGGPIGGQTRVTLRNEHMSYIVTWFSLGAATTYMWLKKFVLKGR